MKNLVLVTGASGFLGSHVVEQLVKHGYSVRALARPAKVARVRAAFKKLHGNVEVFSVADIVTDDLKSALKGVTAVIHVASPIMGRSDAKTTLDGAIRGTESVLKQAVAAGVRNIVVTSSRSSLIEPGKPRKFVPEVYTDQDWNHVTEEEALINGDPFYVYVAAKALAERAAWRLAKDSPEVDLTTVLPPLLFGPFITGLEPSHTDMNSRSSVALLYLFLNGDSAPFGEAYPTFCDVRDAALVHVLALGAPPTSVRKRVLVSGGSFQWTEAVDYLRKTRPELSTRLNGGDSKALPVPAPLDTRKARELLGLREFTPWRITMVDALDDLVRMERSWGQFADASEVQV